MTQVFYEVEREKGKTSDGLKAVKNDLLLLLSLTKKEPPDMDSARKIIRRMIIVHTRYHQLYGKVIEKTIQQITSLKDYPTDAAAVIHLARALSCGMSVTPGKSEKQPTAGDSEEKRRRAAQSKRDKAKAAAEKARKEKERDGKGQGPG